MQSLPGASKPRPAKKPPRQGGEGGTTLTAPAGVLADTGADSCSDAGSDACAGALLATVPVVMQFIRQHMRRHAGYQQARLTVPQFRVMVLLDECPAASVSAAAEQVGLSLPAASRMVASLVAKGLVRRAGCADDRRQVALTLTDEGLALLRAARRHTQDQAARVIERLGPGGREAVARALELLRPLFEAERCPCAAG